MVLNAETIKSFAADKGAELTVMENGEHWFHTEEQMEFLNNWIGKEKGLKFYPVMICIASRVINGDDHFKMGFNENNELVVFESVDPCYTDFIPELEDFNVMSTPYSSKMKSFYQAIRDEMEKNKGVPCPGPENAGPNTFSISTLPWVNYSSINLHYFNEWAGLAPMVFWGKYVEKERKLMLPVTLQVRHSVCDGYHAAKFFMDMEKAIPEVIEVLNYESICDRCDDKAPEDDTHHLCGSG